MPEMANANKKFDTFELCPNSPFTEAQQTHRLFSGNIGTNPLVGDKLALRKQMKFCVKSMRNNIPGLKEQ